MGKPELQASIDGRRFVWAVFFGDGETAEVMALSEQGDSAGFVPAFVTKEDGLMALGRLAQPGRPRGEVQAIALEILTARAGAQGLNVLLVDGEGRVLGEADDSLQSQ